jgi:hypothetical protein
MLEGTARSRLNTDRMEAMFFRNTPDILEIEA